MSFWGPNEVKCQGHNGLNSSYRPYHRTWILHNILLFLWDNCLRLELSHCTTSGYWNCYRTAAYSISHRGLFVYFDFAIFPSVLAGSSKTFHSSGRRHIEHFACTLRIEAYIKRLKSRIHWRRRTGNWWTKEQAWKKTVIPLHVAKCWVDARVARTKCFART